MSSRKVRTTAKKASRKSAPKAKGSKTTAKKASKARSAKAKAPRKRAAKAPAPVPPSLTTSEKLAVVERYIAAYNGRDVAAILALYHPDARMEDPVGLPPAVGHEAIAALYQMGFDMGVSVAHDGVVRCTANAVAFPLVASSPTSKLHVIDVFEFGPSGLVERMRAYWGPDNLEGELAVRQ